MKNKTKLLIIAVIAIILIVIAYIIIMNIYKKRDVYHEDIPMEEDVQKITNTSGKFQKLENITDYYTVKSCISKFFSSYFSTFESESQDQKQKLYNTLNIEYITYKGITPENITSKLEKIGQSVLTVNNVLSLTNYDGMYLYLAEITLRNSQNNINTDMNIMLILDRNNMTYNVLLDDFIKEKGYNNLNVGDSISFEIPKNIELNNNNAFGYLSFSYDDYAKDLFNKFRNDLIYNPDKAYELLDEEFKTKNYPTKESFISFIDNNYKTIYLLKYASYTNEIVEENVYYICMDSNGNVFVTFHTYAPMEYTYEFTME